MRKWKYLCAVILIILLALLIGRSCRQAGVQMAQVKLFHEGQSTQEVSVVASRPFNEVGQTEPFMKNTNNTPILHIPGQPMREEEVQASVYGAKARITLHVVDSKGNDVNGADVTGSFAGTKNPKELYKAKTDVTGRVILDAVHAGYMVNISVKKDQYYNTWTEHHFDLRGYDCVKDGCWIPWNPTLEVVLKERRNPISMYQNFVETVMPAGTNRLGFDFLVGDWIVPHGKGSNADMWYVYDETFIDRDNFYIKLSFVFPGENNGCYMRKTDNYSEFVSEHEATETGFETSFVSIIEQEKGKYTKEKRFGENDYMIFRIRTKTDDQGKIISSHYGKIYGPVGVPHRWSKKFSFTYYLNPTQNDRNLEYAPTKNLVPEEQRHTMNRNIP